MPNAGTPDIGRMAELSEAFGPATIPGLTARYWALKGEIRRLQSEHDNLRVILAEHCGRTGEAVEVDGLPALRPIVKGYSASGGALYDVRFDAKAAR